MDVPEPAELPAVGSPPTGGELNAAITSAIVGIHNHHLGRGPSSATTFQRNEVVVTVLAGVLSRAEQTLVAEGKADAVMQMRHLFQQAMQRDFVAAVERLSGCTVRAFISGNNPDPDMATEVFVLERAEGPG